MQGGDPSLLIEQRPRDLPQPGARHHFPNFLVPFFGRQQEIARIMARLADPQCRIFTVTGPGGTGKSRLLVEAVQHLNPLNYPDGLYFVPLAPISNPEEMIRAIAEAVSIPLVEGVKIKPQLLRGLSSLRLLLVLDNFEHLMDAAPLVLEILEKAPGVTCLVSSRQPLQLQAEWLLPLSGLDYPTESAEPQIEQYSAVAFFLDRARRVRPEFEPSSADYRSILEICRLVDGMPLAITMAAAWLSVYDCAAIAAQIGKNLDFFAVPLRDLPLRHQSMRATFEVSWRLLPPSAQQTLARLSVFHGAFTYAAAQTVVAASPLDLVRLVTHSLLTRVAADRYSLHELLRQFAAEKLAELKQIEAIRCAHTRYYLALLAAEEREMVGAGQLQAIERLHADLPNLRAAWLAAGADRQWATVQQSLKAFERYWLATGRQVEGQNLLAAVAAHLADDLNLSPVAYATNGHDASLSLGQRRELLTRIRLAQGLFAHAYAPLQEAIDVVQVALGLAETADAISADLVGEIHLALSWLYHHQGHRARVEDHLNEAYARLHTSADAALQSRLYQELSGLAGQKGDQTQRRAHLERAVVLAEESGDLAVDFTARRHLAHMQIRWGDFSRVRHHIDRLLHNAQQVKNVLIEAQALSLYAGYYFYVGDFERMAVYNAQAYPLLQKVGGVQHLAIYQMRQGLHALFVGDFGAAIRIAHQSIDFARIYHHRDLEALSSVLLGRAQTQIGAFEAGWDSFEQAIQVWDTHGRSMEYQTALLGQASILLAQGKVNAALERIEPYLPIILTGDLGIVVDYGHVYADAYRILHAAADPRVGDLLARAYTVLTRVVNTIPDADLRHSFWQNNPSHRFILAQQPHVLAL
jgi:predicted ATPase